MSNKDLKYWLAFSHLPQIGAARLLSLLKFFPNLKTAWQASDQEINQTNLDQRSKENIILHRVNIDPDKLLAEVEKQQIKIWLFTDQSYPPLLKEIYDPPAILYYRGDLNIQKNTLAIVGTRKISPYGTQIVKDLIPPLCHYHLVTVSGMALGVDALVHQETLSADGQTVAVLGNGLDDANLYPSSNRYLAKKIIAAGGLLISEYPPGTLPLKQHFPRRNRIISGLSQAVLVIEGDIESGSLITATTALEQNREVMAVPGSIYANNSAGPNNLIKKGAHLISGYQDIIDILNLQEIYQPPIAQPTDPKQQLIIEILTSQPMDIDEIIRRTQIPAAEINMHLSIMELQKMIKKMADGKFVISRS